MPSIKRLRILRFFERFLSLFSLAWVGGLAYLHGIQELTAQELAAGAGVLLLLLVIKLFMQHRIDLHFQVAQSQSSYGHDAAFAALFERSPVAYLIIDARGKILESNQAAIKLLQTDSEIIKNVNFFSRLEATETLDPTILQEKVRAGMTLYDVEVPLLTLAENQVWVMLSTFAYQSSGQRLISLVDVTEQKHIDTAKSEFVALATHQLRTPIAAVRWNVELLQKNLAGTVTEPQERYLDKISRNILRMNSLIDDFLSVSKLEMGTYATKEEAVDLTEFFSGVIDEFSGKLTEKQIELERNELPPHAVISIDGRLLHIIVSNLISNAVKYLRAQGRLGLSYQLENRTLTIVVADDGIGIPEAELGKLFTKFYRASNAQSHQTEGTGLGLYIVQQSVELLGGSITVQSKEDQGARFEVILPVKVVVQQEIG